MEDTLGIDIGGVIIKPAETKGDTSFFTEDYLSTPMFEGVIEAIQLLRERRFGENIHIVSKCGPNVQRKSLDWLEHHDFYRRTGLDRGRVHFCLKRPQKAGICERLGITAFIDDRLDVLCHMTNVETRIHFCGSARSRAAINSHNHAEFRCETWREVTDTLLT